MDTKKTREMIAGWALLAIMIGGIYAWESNKNENHDAAAPVTVTSVPSPIQIADWWKFTQEWNENEIAFDLKYRDRRLAFVTVILQASIDADGHALLGIIGNPGAILKVQDRDKAEAAKVNPASQIAAVCDYIGKPGGLLVFDECHISVLTAGVK